MCANGPARRSGSVLGSAASSTRISRIRGWRSIVTRPSPSSSAWIRSSTTRSMYARSAATAASRRRWRRDASGSPSRCRAASSSGRSDTVQAWASSRCSFLNLIAGEPGSAPAEVGGHRPQVSDEIGGLDQRPRSVESAVQLRILEQRPAEQLSWHFFVCVLVDQVRQQRLPDLLASLVVRRTGVWCFERLGPIGGTDPDVGPRRSRPSGPR